MCDMTLAWGDYFQDIATPIDSVNIDNDHHRFVEKDIIMWY